MEFLFVNIVNQIRSSYRNKSKSQQNNNGNKQIKFDGNNAKNCLYLRYTHLVDSSLVPNSTVYTNTTWSFGRKILSLYPENKLISLAVLTFQTKL